MSWDGCCPGKGQIQTQLKWNTVISCPHRPGSPSSIMTVRICRVCLPGFNALLSWEKPLDWLGSGPPRAKHGSGPLATGDLGGMGPTEGNGPLPENAAGAGGSFLLDFGLGGGEAGAAVATLPPGGSGLDWPGTSTGKPRLKLIQRRAESSPVLVISGRPWILLSLRPVDLSPGSSHIRSQIFRDGTNTISCLGFLSLETKSADEHPPQL